MGLFDYLRFRDREYQTKCTPAQCMTHYAIRNDGGLYEQTKEGWKFCDSFTGSMTFYRSVPKSDQIIYNLGTWQEWQALISRGWVLQMSEIERGR